MAIEVTRDAPRVSAPPVDPDVHIPESVRRAAERAESFYKTQPDQPPAADPSAPPAEPVVEPVAPVAADQEPPVAPAASPPVEPVKPAVTPTAPPADDENLSAAEWRHRYLSMKGRYDQQQVTIGSMQEQMQEIGNELIRTQQYIQRGQQAPNNPPPAQTKLITAEDEQNYGSELIDLTRRAAVETVAPEIEALRNETRDLKQTIVQQKQQALRAHLDEHVPNWREINTSPRFKKWLSLPDIYSGSVRRALLNGAYQAADAPRVASFFDGFLSEERVTGNIDPAPPLEQPPPAPRQPAVPLERLAAPGRARPASGDTPAPVEKPVFTKQQIKQFYADVRAQRYAGREAEKNALEAQIFAAQNEGRIR